MIKIQATKLIKGVTFVNRTLRENLASPIVQNIQFAVVKNKLYMKVTDLRTTLITYVNLPDYKGEEGLTFLMPGKALSSLLSTMSSKDTQEQVEIKVGKDYSHSVKWSTGKQKLTGEDAKLFPKKTIIDKSKAISIDLNSQDRDSFIKALQYVLFACSTEELKPSFTGVNLVGSDSNLLCITSDGATFAMCPVILSDEQDSAAKISAIIPKDFMSTLVNASEETDEAEHLFLSLTDRLIEIKLGTFVLTSSLIDSVVLPYQGVINATEKYKLSFSFSRLEMLTALRRNLLTTSQLGYVTIETFGETLEIRSSESDNNKETVSNVNLIEKGSIGYIAHFIGSRLLKILTNTADEVLTVKYNSEREAVVIHGENERAFMLLMPIDISKA